MSNLIHSEVYDGIGTLFTSPKFLSIREQEATKSMVISSLFFFFFTILSLLTLEYYMNP